MDKIQEKLNQFPENFKSAVLATMTKDQELYTSYAPFVNVEGNYYFIISKIAKHYENLSNHPKISFILIEDEKAASNIFFRKRLSYQAETDIDIHDEQVKDAFIAMHGEMAEMLFNMDFTLVKTTIKQGQFIIGPGMAYEVDEKQNIIQQIKTNKGHGHK